MAAQPAVSRLTISQNAGPSALTATSGDEAVAESCFRPWAASLLAGLRSHPLGSDCDTENLRWTSEEEEEDDVIDLAAQEMQTGLGTMAQKAFTARKLFTQETIKAVLLAAMETHEPLTSPTEERTTAPQSPAPRERRIRALPSRVKQLRASFERRCNAGAQPPQNGPERCKETTVLRQLEVDGTTFFNQYMVVSFLAAGNFGKVHLCFNTEDHCLYAVKCVKKTMTMERKVSLKSLPELEGDAALPAEALKRAAPKPVDPMIALAREIDIMKSMRHPNIVSLYEVVDDPCSSRMLLVLPYMAGGSLAARRPSEGGAAPFMHPDLARLHVIGISSGLKHMHDAGVVHGDIKPDNLLLGGAAGVALSDLGCASRGGDALLKRPRHGTPAFMAPEMSTARCRYNGKLADVYALGVTLYTLLCGRMPFTAETVPQIFQKHRCEPLTFPPDPDLDSSLKGLIAHMMAKDPSERATVEEVLAHPWVQQGLQQELPSSFLPAPDPHSIEAALSAYVAPVGEPPLQEEDYVEGECLVKEGKQGGTSFLIRSGEVEVSLYIPVLPVSPTGSLGPESQHPHTLPAISPTRPLVSLLERGSGDPGAADGTTGSPVRTAVGDNGAAHRSSAAAFDETAVAAAAAAYGAADGAVGGAPSSGLPSLPVSQPVNRRMFAWSGKEVSVSDDLLMGKIRESCARARLVLSRRLIPGSERQYALARRRSGELVGEMAPLQAVKPARRCASVRACGAATVLAIPEAHLHAVLAAAPVTQLRVSEAAWARRSEKTVLQALARLADLNTEHW